MRPAPTPAFSFSDPTLSDAATPRQTYLVTGASSGIGYATSLALAQGGARVWMVSRPGRQGEAQAEAVRRASGNDAVAFLPADLSSMSEVRRLAAEVTARVAEGGAPLAALVNNAGVYLGERRVSADGYEMTFALNHLAPFLLSGLLLEQLEPTGRIVVVSSEAARMGRLHEDPLLRRGYSGWRAYAQSKLANLLFTAGLAERLESSGTGGRVVNALHPGTVATGFARDGGGVMSLVFRVLAPLLKTPEQGAADVLRLARDPAFAGANGVYLKGGEPAPMPPRALEPDAQARLWALSEELTGFRSPLAEVA